MTPREYLKAVGTRAEDYRIGTDATHLLARALEEGKIVKDPHEIVAVGQLKKMSHRRRATMAAIVAGELKQRLAMMKEGSELQESEELPEGLATQQ